MAADSPITLLKRLFLSFFEKIKEPSGKERKYRIGAENFDERRYRADRKTWQAYKESSKATILGLNDTVVSLSDVIGQAGIDAWNTWIATYAGGTGAITSEGLKALKDWYDTYLKPLS